jgi:CHAT domain-containing protein
MLIFRKFETTEPISLKGTALMKAVLFRIGLSFLAFLIGNLAIPSIAVLTSHAQNLPTKLHERDTVLLETEARQAATVWNEDSYRRARALYQETAQSALGDGNPRRYAACLREAARLSISLNELDAAWQMLSDSLSAEKKTKNIAGESETLSSLTLIALWKKNLKSAEHLQRESLVLAEKSKQPATIAKAYFAAAEYFYRNQRNLPLMMELQEKSLHLFRAAGDQTSETQILTVLAYTYVMDNDRSMGRTYAAEAVKLARQTGNKRDLAFALIALGDATQRVGDWQEAYQSFTEAQALYPENLDFTEKAILFVRFGFHYEIFGDLIQASSYFEKARDLFIKTRNLYGSSELATRIGQISLQLGEEAKALENLNKGLQIGVLSKDRYSVAYSYENFGEFYFLKREYRIALSYYQRALTNFDRVGIKHAVASVQEKIGKLHFLSGDNRLAEKFYSEALQINRNIRSRAGQASSLYDLAELHQAEGSTEISLREMDECLYLTDFLSGETANGKLRQSFLADIFDRYELYINLLMKMQKKSPNENYAVRALQAAERSRARSMLENLSFAEIRSTKDADSETVKREKEIRILLNARADKLTDLLSGNPDTTEIEKVSGEINELENEFEEIKASLKQNSPEYSAIRNPPPFDTSGFRDRVLDENTLLLEFSFGKDESYLWLTGKNFFSSFVLPGRDKLESRIQRLRELVTSRDMKQDETVEDYQIRMSEAERLYWQEAQVLSNELLGQISNELYEKRLIIVPDGKLHYFPLSALPLPNSNTWEPILVTNETIYEPSASTLLLLQQTSNEPRTGSKDLLVFSDPVFSADDPRLSAQSASVAPATATNFRFAESLSSLPRLAASKTEGDSIANIVGTSQSYVLSGFSATRERVLAPEMSDYRIIHFATHGWIDEEHPELSGIILSRFDENGQGLDEFVRLQDIYGLRLSADLVVLSACKTGVGKELRGEGLISLTNGFIQSGAGSVLSSLWKVDDNATLELMTNFYVSLVSDNLSASKALRNAQMKMWQDPRYRSPFYWAAFTIQGDYRRTSQFTSGYRYTGYLWIVAGLVILLSIYGLYRVRAERRQLLNAKRIGNYTL